MNNVKKNNSIDLLGIITKHKSVKKVSHKQSAFSAAKTNDHILLDDDSELSW